MVPVMTDVTVAFVFRERVSPTIEKLAALIARTRTPHKLIVFDNASPPAIARELARLRDAHGFRLLRSDEVLTPNAQRNRCLAEVDTRFVVFIDNDVDVNENWLEPLVTAADTTGAGLVAPLYLERMKGKVRIHLWDGVVRTVRDDGSPMFQERHHLAHADLDENRGGIVPRDGGLVEFHAVLVDTALLRSLGGLDPQLMSLSEHAHLSVQVLRAGRRIYLEPASVITYDIPARLDPMDREYFLLRWSEAWNRASADRLAELYGLAPDDPDLQAVFYWGRFHRQRATIRVRSVRKVLGGKGEAFVRRVAHALEWRRNERKYRLAAAAAR
jgi:GT2 family glycosyltransferase